MEQTVAALRETVLRLKEELGDEPSPAPLAESERQRPATAPAWRSKLQQRPLDGHA